LIEIGHETTQTDSKKLNRNKNSCLHQITTQPFVNIKNIIFFDILILFFNIKNIISLIT